jgi:hypothetical protein
MNPRCVPREALNKAADGLITLIEYRLIALGVPLQSEPVDQANVYLAHLGDRCLGSWGNLHRAASEVIEVIGSYLAEDGAVHMESAISAAGSLAGVALLRSSGVDLSAFPSGPDRPSMILSDKVNEAGPALLDSMAAFCVVLELDGRSGWMTEIPPDRQPSKQVWELVRDLEAPCARVFERFQVPIDLRPHYAAFAAIMLVKLAETVLSPDIGKALAISAAVAASKVVPWRTPEVPK